MSPTSLLRTIIPVALSLYSVQAFSADPYTLADKACAQLDDFVAKATIDSVKKLHPEQADELQAYYERGCIHEASGEAAEYEWFSGQTFNGELESAANLQSGTSNRKDVSLAGAMQHSIGRIRSNLEGIARQQEEEDVATAEEYRLGYRGDYKLSSSWFGSGEVDYVDDRFSGYDFRMSQTAGLGYIIHDDEDVHLEVRGGVGASQNRLVNGQQETSFLTKTAMDMEWHMLERVTLGKKAEALFASDANIYAAETSLKSNITDSLALKAAYNLEYIDNAIDNNRPADTRTTLGVIYGF